MPQYAFKIEYTGHGSSQSEDHLTPHAFVGSADEFARAVLRDLISRDPSLTQKFTVVSVWDAEAEGVGEIRHRAALVTTHDLDLGPFPDNQLQIDYHTYYVASFNYNIHDDDILGVQGRDVTHGVPYGLVVPGSGPALKIRTGHRWGYITLDVSMLDSEPAADLAAWEAIEQATIRPRADVRICDWNTSLQDHFPDLTRGRRSNYLTIRVSARGRDAEITRSPAVNPRRVPMEHHMIEAWPASASAPRRVLKRDGITLYWESTAPHPAR